MSASDRSPLDPSRPLRVACIGGGPGGLFAAIALAKARPGTSIDVYERNDRNNVFGFGVVFSDATLDNVDRVDPVLHDVLAERGRHWDTIRVHSNGVTIAAAGNGMSAVHRRILLDALRARAAGLGARLHYAAEAGVDQLDAGRGHDLIIAADGTNSATRERFRDRLGHRVDIAAVKFIWFATTYEFLGLTFLHKRSQHGNFAVHAYPIGSGLSTFIVETDEDTWRRAGLDGFDTSAPPGQSDENTQRYLERLFADEIDGHPLVGNNSRWANFHTRRTQRWYARGNIGTPVAFVGDAVHTAHFSVGSGTKMAMEDAAVLAGSVAQHPDDLDAALASYARTRVPQVAKIQDSAVPSLSWWDHFGQYQRFLEPWQFGFHFFSRAIGAEKLRVRDAHFVAESERAWRDAHDGCAPLATPLPVAGRTFGSRLLRVGGRLGEGLRVGDGNVWLNAVPAGQRTADGDVPLFTAPDVTVATLDAPTRQALDKLVSRAPPAVVIAGGNAVTRVLCAEQVRMAGGLAAIIVDDAGALRARRAVDERDCAETLVLSGRADAVAFDEDKHDE